MINTDEITEFISYFHGSEDVFLHGCCYWFAFILHERFGLDIGYDPIEGHFLASGTDVCCMPDGTQFFKRRRYDIRGEVTDLCEGNGIYSIDWLKVHEPSLYASLMRDCRDFIVPTDEELEVS